MRDTVDRSKEIIPFFLHFIEREPVSFLHLFLQKYLQLLSESSPDIFCDLFKHIKPISISLVQKPNKQACLSSYTVHKGLYTITSNIFFCNQISNTMYPPNV